MISFYKNKKVLVTGAGGFVASHLLPVLNKICPRVFLLSDKKIGNNPFNLFIGNLRNKTFIKDVIVKTQPDVVFNLAAIKNRTAKVDDVAIALENNFNSTFNLLSALTTELSSPLTSVVLLGSLEEYGNQEVLFNETLREKPVSAYSLSKVCASYLGEFFYRTYSLPVTTLRPSIAYGPKQGTEMFLPAIINAILKKQKFDMTQGNQTRDFIFITDLVDAILKTPVNSSKVAGKIINLGSGNSVTLRELITIIENLSNLNAIANFGVLDYRANEIMQYSTEIKLAKELLSWEPKTSLTNGLKIILENYKNSI